MTGTAKQISIEELRERTLFIAAPIYGGKSDFPFTFSLFHTGRKLMHMGIPMQPHLLANESLITRARNYCADEFLRSGMMNLLFIDADIGYSPDDIVSLLAFAEPGSPHDIICGAYPKKVIAWEKVYQAYQAGIGKDNPNDLENFVGDLVLNLEPGNYALNQPLPVKESGTGFMLIQRHVFEKIAERYPEFYYHPDHGRTKHFDGKRKIMQYFQAEINYGFRIDKVFQLVDAVLNKDETKAFEVSQQIKENYEKADLRYLSEDYLFCRLAEEVGCKTWVLPWIKLSHTGNYVFHSDMEALANISASLTMSPEEMAKKK